MLKKLLTKMDEMGGLFKAPPLSDEGFEKLVDRMRALSLDLPDEYAELLFTSDGLYWGGLEFFGSVIHVDKKNNFNITDLPSQNRLFQALNPDRAADVIIGHTDEENYVYNSSKKKYEIVSEFENTVLKSFDSFEELFEYVTTEQIELVENYVAFNEDEIKDDETDEDY